MSPHAAQHYWNKLNQGPKQTITEGKVFFAEDTHDRDIKTNIVNHLSGKITRDRSIADFIVIDNMVKPGVRNELAMVLRGGCLVSSKCITGGPMLAPGTRIAFKSPLDQPKWIFMSQDFKDVFQGITKVIESAIGAQPTPRRWKLLSYDEVIVWDSLLSNVPLSECQKVSFLPPWRKYHPY